MSVHVLLNLLNKLGKAITCETSLINSIILEHKC